MSADDRSSIGTWSLALGGVLSAWTAVTAAAAWTVLTLDDPSWIWRAAVLGLVVAASGWGTRLALGPRRFGLPAVVMTAFLQVTLGLIAGWWLISSAALPWTADASSVWHRIGDAIDTSMHNRPPVPASDVLPVLLAGVLAAAVVIDLVAVGMRRPAVAGIAVVGIWVATFFDDPVEPTVWMIGLPAAGWCALLVLINPTAVGASDESWTGRAHRRAWIGASGLAVAAISVSVIVTAIVPVNQIRVFNFDGGSGPGGNGLRVTNPMVDMRNQLIQSQDQSLVTLQTDNPDPSYLRLTVLTTYQDLQWTPGTRTVPSTNTPNGTLPPLMGVSKDIARSTYHYIATGLSGFRSKWLPTTAPITSITTEGDWRYDSSTMDFLAADNKLTSLGTRWQMDGVELDLRSADLQDLSPSSVVGVRFLELPESFPKSVRTLARNLTASATSPFAKAVALQTWFRTGGGFTYDTDVALGDGTDALQKFLAVGNRRGFCQQFASSMAAMARALSIPSRVVVGFLKPTRVSDTDTWVYSSHDLHAWPELYFQGAGWVRFEPTPSARVARVPSYTQNLRQVTPAGPDDGPSAAASAQPEGPSQRPASEDAQTQSTDNATGHTRLWIGGAVALLVLALLSGPWTVRTRRRRRRLRDADPEALWAELRDTAIDLDVAWPDHDSVRRQAASLPRSADNAHAVAGSLTRLQTAVEVERYARGGATTTVEERAGAREDLSVITGALWEAAGPRTRRRAHWWPPSLRRRP